jgi:hypothetical protein
MKTYEENDDLICEIGIDDHNGPAGWSFGLMMLKPYIFMYDFEKGRIGKDKI